MSKWKLKDGILLASEVARAPRDQLVDPKYIISSILFRKDCHQFSGVSDTRAGILSNTHIDQLHSFEKPKKKFETGILHELQFRRMKYRTPKHMLPTV
jgi:hypothetical protein